MSDIAEKVDIVRESILAQLNAGLSVEEIISIWFTQPSLVDTELKARAAALADVMYERGKESMKPKGTDEWRARLEELWARIHDYVRATGGDPDKSSSLRSGLAIGSALLKFVAACQDSNVDIRERTLPLCDCTHMTPCHAGCPCGNPLMKGICEKCR